MMNKISVIGLGSMGMGVARSLLRASLPVIGADIDPDNRRSFENAGGACADSAAEASKDADCAIIVVVNAEQTARILFGSDGIAPVLKPGAVVISCATMSPQDARDLEERARTAGLHYLDAPLSGGAARAAQGQLTVMASGTRRAFDATAPVLKAIASSVYELGDRAGLGATYKIINQLLAGVHIAAACEAMVLAARLGLDLQQAYEIITASAGNSWMFENRVPHILAGDYSPKSAVDIFTKDLGIVASIGQSEKFPLHLTSAALQLFVATSAAGMGRDDDASVARLLAQIANVALPSKQD